MKILVTGAAGFIGSHVALTLRERGHEVVCVDTFEDTPYPTYEKLWRAEQLDAVGVNIRRVSISEPNLRPLLKGVDVIINEAAIPGLSNSWSDPEAQFVANCTNVQRLVMMAAQEGVPHIVHASTSSVYGLTALGNEESSLQPVSPYGISKCAAELTLKAAASTYQIGVTILRYFSVYGPGQRSDMAYMQVLKALQAGIAFTLCGNGFHVRSNTYVEDAVEVTVRAAELGIPGVFNIAGTEETTLNEAISKLENLMGKELRVICGADRAGDQVKTNGDTTRAREVLGYSPKWNMDSGLSQFHAWFVKEYAPRFMT